MAVIVVGQSVRPADRLDRLRTLEITHARGHVERVNPTHGAEATLQLLARYRGFCNEKIFKLDVHKINCLNAISSRVAFSKVMKFFRYSV